MEAKGGKPQENNHAEAGGGWKFWRRLSARGRNEPRKSSALHRKERPEIVLLEKSEPAPEDSPDTPLTKPLPDVVDKAPTRQTRANSSAVPPPKPPRLFLIRTPSTRSTSQHSTTDGVPSTEDDATYMNCERVAQLKSQLQSSSTPDKDSNDSTSAPQSLSSHTTTTQAMGENNNVLDKYPTPQHTQHIPRPEDRIHHQTTTQTSQPPHNNNNIGKVYKTSPNGALPTVRGVGNGAPQRLQSSSSSRSQSTSSATSPQNPKIVTPELRTKRPGRRRRSSEKGDITRQRHVMNNVAELLRQRLDPYPLLEPLRQAGVLSKADVQTFLAQKDRKTVCESLVDIVGDGSPATLNAFSDVLASVGTATEILEVLSVMREMDRIVHEEPHSAPPESTVLAEEKNLNFDVGYLAPDLSLKPLVELERVRASNDKRLSKASSRASAYSLLEGDGEGSGEVGVFPGLLMVSICVTGHAMCGPRTEALAHLVQAQNCVSELHLGKTQLTGEDLDCLADALQANSTVHSLDVRLNTLGKAGARAIAQLLLHTKSLRCLNLSSTCLDVDGLRTVAQAAAGNKSLVDLDLSFLEITDDSCVALRDLVRSGMSGLQKLRLRNNDIGWSGCYSLAEGLVKNRCLTVLDLSRNQIGNEGLQALAKYLPDSSVQELYLENCGLTFAACDRLGDLVAHCKRIRTLDVSTNLLNDVGIDKLAPSLERTCSLQSLSLNMCGVTNDGFSRLLAVLEKNTSIVHIKLCYNRLGREHKDPEATSDNLRYRLRIVTSSKPKLKILLWGNNFDES